MAYTDEDTVRIEYFFLRNEENLTGKTGTTLLLKERAYAINSIIKDGTTLSSPADFSFQAPRTITLAVAAVVGNFFEIETDTNLKPTQITRLITKAENLINGKLVRRYESLVPFTTVPPLVKEIATILVGAFSLRSMLFKNHSVKSGALKTSDNLMKEAMELLKKLDKAEIDLLDDSGNLIEGSGTDISVGRAGDKLFDTLTDYTEVNIATIELEKTL